MISPSKVTRTLWFSGFENSMRATSAEAAPPVALKKETSWGMAVILMRRATTAPITPPKAIAPRMMARLAPLIPPPSPSRWSTMVAIIAMIIPVAAHRFPRRAESGLLNSFSPATKKRAETRYINSSIISPFVIFSVFMLQTYFFFFLNISSMRSVTTNPPITLSVPNSRAKIPSTRLSRLDPSPRFARSA